MGVIHGNMGTIKAGTPAAKVASVQDFTINHEAPESDITAMGDAWEDVMGGPPQRWTITMNCQVVDDDTAQAALVPGATVPWEGYADGEATGAKFYAGNVYIRSVSRSQNKSDPAAITIEGRGKGALTTDTVPA